MVDFVLVRTMFVQPHLPPWMCEEGKSQQMMGVRLVCHLAAGFAEAGWEVVILDVLSNQTAQLYRSLLKKVNLRVVQLLPAFIDLQRRFYERGARLTNDELKMIYRQQCEYTDYDLRIDNTDVMPEKVAEMTAPLL